MPDEQILVAGTSPAPLSYTVPNAIEAALLCVNASLNGAAASGAFLPTVEIVSDGGVVVARCPCFTTIAAGGSAEVSWFRLRTGTPVQAAQTTYENLILTTPGLRAYWKLDETSGSTAFDSGNAGVDLPYQNSPTLGQPPLADVTAVSFTAALSQFVGHYVSTGSLPLQGNHQMTVEYWIKTTNAVTTAHVWSDSGAADGRFFRVEQSALGIPTFSIFGTDATGHSLSGATAVNDGAVHYLVGTFDGTTMKWYVDAVLDASVNPAMGGFPLANTNRGIALGAKFNVVPSYSEFLTGTLDEVSIYDLALTQSQITEHFQAA